MRALYGTASLSRTPQIKNDDGDTQQDSPSLLAKGSSTVVMFGACVEVKGTAPDLADDCRTV